MNVPLFSDRLCWSSTIGLFIINYGVLEHQLLEFLISRLATAEFESIREKHVKDRVDEIQKIVSNEPWSDEQRRAYDDFFQRLDPIRKLRNRIAHGYVQFDAAANALSLSLPRDINKAIDQGPDRLNFDAVYGALTDLNSLIEDFNRLFLQLEPARVAKRGQGLAR